MTLCHRAETIPTDVLNGGFGTKAEARVKLGEWQLWASDEQPFDHLSRSEKADEGGTDNNRVSVFEIPSLGSLAVFLEI